MFKGMKTVLVGAVIVTSLSIAVGAQAANVNVCFGADVNNVALNSLVSGIENGLVIIDSTNTTVVAANNYYKNGAGTYWTSALPQNVTLKSGCYTFYFMTKPTAPSGTTSWICNAPAVFPANNLTMISGALGNIQTGFVLVPATATNGSNDSSAACPQAN